MMRRRIAPLLMSTALLSGCAEVDLFGHFAKKAQEDQSPPAAATTGGGLYKVGKPYKVAGVWYYPREDWDYDETGIASYYAEQFHGGMTANGETFDMNAVTAAHKTLPLPSLVRVTNLENGRSLVVRVNDRGPFVNGRIIDLSRRSAQLLGMERQGTAKVRVQILGDESRALAMGLRREGAPAEPVVAAAPRESVKAESLPPPGGRGTAGSAPAVTMASASPSQTRMETASASAARQVGTVHDVPVRASSIYVQVGSFSRYDNAQRLSARMSGIGRSQIEQAQVKGQTVYRVRLGPAASVEEADRILDEAVAAGQQDARVVVD